MSVFPYFEHCVFDQSLKMDLNYFPIKGKVQKSLKLDNNKVQI